MARGAALDRACTRHSWVVLNGRCRSDPAGSFTNYHLSRRTVLDLAIVPRVARADLRVVSVLLVPWGHRGLLVHLHIFLDSVAAALPAVTFCPVHVKLTPAQSLAFTHLYWT